MVLAGESLLFYASVCSVSSLLQLVYTTQIQKVLMLRLPLLITASLRLKHLTADADCMKSPYRALILYTLLTQAHPDIIL